MVGNTRKITKCILPSPAPSSTVFGGRQSLASPLLYHTPRADRPALEEAGRQPHLALTSQPVLQLALP